MRGSRDSKGILPPAVCAFPCTLDDYRSDADTDTLCPVGNKNTDEVSV